MSRDEEIQALLDQAEALKKIDAAEQKLEKATEAYRKTQTDRTKTAYRTANEELAAVRAAARADRAGTGVGGDAFVSGEDK